MANERRKLIAVKTPPTGTTVFKRLPTVPPGVPLVRQEEGTIDLVCSACQTVVAESIEPKLFDGPFAIQCECGRYCLTR